MIGCRASHLWQLEEVHRVHADQQHPGDLTLPPLHYRQRSSTAGNCHHPLHRPGHWHGEQLVGGGLYSVLPFSHSINLSVEVLTIQFLPSLIISINNVSASGRWPLYRCGHGCRACAALLDVWCANCWTNCNILYLVSDIQVFAVCMFKKIIIIMRVNFHPFFCIYNWHK